MLRLNDTVWPSMHMHTAGVPLLALLLTELQCMQQEAVLCRAITCPPAQPGLLAHASQHKASAPGNVQSIYEALRWQASEWTQPLRA